MKKIKILDTTLRDGEQSPGYSMTMEQKIEIAKHLDKMKVDIIEAGFAASNEKDKKAIEEISKVCNYAIISSFARCKKEDIEIAYDAIKYAKKKRIHIFLATSPIHRKYKLRKTKEQIKEMTEEGISYAKSLCKDIEFSLEDITRTEREFACEIIDAAISAGVTTINIADTVGYMTPIEYCDLINYLKNNSNLCQVNISVHCHNDLGMATANTVMAIKNDIDQIECTINGIGERAGNTALEEVVAIIKTKQDILKVKTGINSKKIKEISTLVEQYTNSKVQNNKAVVGKNAFLHEAGIHQQGVLKKRSTYEVLNPKDYGIKTDNIIIGIHSGKAAIIKKMKDLKYNKKYYDIDKITQELKIYFETHKQLSDECFSKLVERFHF